MESTAGLAALALFVLWLGYLVPHRVRHRQQLLDSRTEDRFSGSLRVLAVADPAAGGAVQVNTVDVAPPGTAGDLASGAHRSLLLSASAARSGSGTPDAPSIPPQHQSSRKEEGTHAVETTAPTDRRHAAPSRRGTDATARHDGTGGPAAPGRVQPSGPTRLQVLERRAIVARRRLALTAVLLLATVGAWACVGIGLVPWFVAAVPTALLLLVLAFGRLAVLAGKRADAAWLAQRRASAARAGSPREDSARAGSAASGRGRPVAGGPAIVRNAPPRVTGRAVHGSQLNTQMIPRVTPQDLARAAEARTGSDARAADVGGSADNGARGREGSGRARGVGSGSGSGARADDDSEPERVEPSRMEPTRVESRGVESEGAGPEGAAFLRREGAPSTPAKEAGASERDHVPSGRAWDPVPVPRPTYTMKASAPRRGPAPSAGTVPGPVAASGASATQTARSVAEASGRGAPASGQAEESAPPAATRAAGDEAKPRTETLGLDLNEILARRRAAGQ